jgi:hypothetical protein
MENVLSSIDDKDNPLLAPVHIPEDRNAVLKSDHPAVDILTQSGIVVQRQIEMMNIFLGFEQANRYVILDPHGNHIGYMAEHDGGLGKSLKRQFFNTHRAFTTHVFDRSSREVLRFHRPFSWINTRIRVYDPWDPSTNLVTSSSKALAEANPDPLPQQQISPIPIEAMRIIGETHSQWAPLRRKYDLFLSHHLATTEPATGPIRTRTPDDLSSMQQNHLSKAGSTDDFTQFARVDEPFLSWDFSLKDENGLPIGNVNRQFRGFGRELFTDTGSYVLSMDATSQQAESQPEQTERGYTGVLGGTSNIGMTLDQRAVMLATAVTIDYDYFSRHSGGPGFMPIWFMGGGGEAAGGAAAGGTAGAGEAAGGAVVGGAGRAVGGAAGAGGIGEGAIAGAGTMAGYEAMQRGMGRGSDGAVDDASPQQAMPDDSGFAGPGSNAQDANPYGSQPPETGTGEQSQGDVWGTADSDPWSEGAKGAGEGGEAGGGLVSQIWDAFFGD